MPASSDSLQVLIRPIQKQLKSTLREIQKEAQCSRVSVYLRNRQLSFDNSSSTPQYSQFVSVNGSDASANDTHRSVILDQCDFKKQNPRILNASRTDRFKKSGLKEGYVYKHECAFLTSFDERFQSFDEKSPPDACINLYSDKQIVRERIPALRKKTDRVFSELSSSLEEIFDARWLKKLGGFLPTLTNVDLSFSDSLYQRITDEGRRLSGADCVAIWAMDPHRKNFLYLAEASIEGDVLPSQFMHSCDLRQSSFKAIVFQNPKTNNKYRPYISSRARHLVPWHEKVRSVFVLPLMDEKNKSILGVISFDSFEIDAFSTSLRRFLSNNANLFGTLIAARKRLVQEAIGTEFKRELIGCSESKQMMSRKFVETSARRLNLDRCTLYWQNKSTKKFELGETSRYHKALKLANEPEKLKIIEMIARHGMSVRLDSEADLQRWDIRSVSENMRNPKLFVPILGDGKTIAVVEAAISKRTSNRHFVEEHRKALVLLAKQFSEGLASPRTERDTFLGVLDKFLTSPNPSRCLLKFLIHETNANGGIIFVTTDDGLVEKSRFHSSDSIPNNLAKNDFDKCIVGRSCKYKIPELFSNDSNLNLFPGISKIEFAQALSFPLLFEEELCGVVLLFSESQSSFGENTLTKLRSHASVISALTYSTSHVEKPFEKTPVSPAIEHANSVANKIVDCELTSINGELAIVKVTNDIKKSFVCKMSSALLAKNKISLDYPKFTMSRTEKTDGTISVEFDVAEHKPPSFNEFYDYYTELSADFLQ